MLEDLTVIHRRKPNLFALNPDIPVWATCLRSIAFVHGQAEMPASMVGDEVFRHQDAYRFLLETVCGIHSPIVGETEVFGQFKIFAAEWTAVEPRRASLVQRLLSEAKELRARYLSGFGTQSYGGWLRKNLRPGGVVHLLGAGQLAREIYPYLAKQSQVRIHARRPHLVDFAPADSVYPVTRQEFDHGTLIIAAPVDGREVRDWLKDRAPHTLIDLRETASTDVVFPEAISLQEIFAQIESTRSRLMPVIKKLQDEIARRSEVLSKSEKIRPQGWDDLCA